MTVRQYKRQDLVAIYEAARVARRTYEAAKSKASMRDHAGRCAWCCGWKDEGRHIHQALTYYSETTP